MVAISQHSSHSQHAQRDSTVVHLLVYVEPIFVIELSQLPTIAEPAWTSASDYDDSSGVYTESWVWGERCCCVPFVCLLGWLIHTHTHARTHARTHTHTHTYTHMCRHKHIHIQEDKEF